MAHKWLLFSGTLLGFLSVAAGAFGAHALKIRISSEMLSIFEVGVRYQMYHALAILIAASLNAPLSGWLFFIGTVIFSGSLIILALTEIRLLGAITPIGGLILLAGWLALGYSVLKS